MILIPFISVFLLMLMRKWGFIEYLSVNGSNLISKMANCNFCLSFWINVLVVVILSFYYDINLIISIMFATPITKYLYEKG